MRALNPNPSRPRVRSPNLVAGDLHISDGAPMNLLNISVAKIKRGD